MSDKFYIGLDIISSSNNGKYKPVSRVTLLLDDENAVTAGDDTGYEIVADCPWATQEMADALLSTFKGYVYQSYEADTANVDPAAELGDGATVDGMYSVIAHLADDGDGYPTIEAPGEAELEDEYPSAGPMEQKFNRKIAQTNSRITKTAEEIRTEVANDLEGLSASFTVELDSISAEIVGVENAISEVELNVGSLTTRIQDAEGGIAQLELTTQEFSASISGLEGDYAELALTLDGLTVTDEEGTTRIKGSSIETDTLYVNAANVTGTVVAERLQGKIVYLRDSDGENQGRITIDSADTADYALDIRSYGALRLTADEGDVFIAADADYDGPFLQLHSGKSEVRAGGGNFCPNEDVRYTCGTKDRSWMDIFINGNSLVQIIGSLETRIEALGG